MAASNSSAICSVTWRWDRQTRTLRARLTAFGMVSSWPTMRPTHGSLHWLRFNVWKEFKGQPITSFSSEDGFVPFEGSIKGSWWQLNAGLTWELDKNTSFYANLGYQRGFGSRDFDAWDGKLGLRWNW